MSESESIASVDWLSLRFCGWPGRLYEIKAVKVFGSRAKGTHALHSDIDLALWGDVDVLQAEAIAAELDE